MDFMILLFLCKNVPTNLFSYVCMNACYLCVLVIVFLILILLFNFVFSLVSFFVNI